MTDANNARFNAEAAAWDNNPDVHVASEHALKAILKAFPKLESEQEKSTDGESSFYIGFSDASCEVAPVPVIEIGCGTGLLTLTLAPYVQSITAIDASHGMIDALTTKLSAPSAATNVHPLCILLEDPEDQKLPASTATDTATSKRKKFDLAISHLVLHHIPSMTSFLQTIYGTLKPGTGEVLVTDFEDFGPEARAFHPEARMAGVERDGIKKMEIEGILSKIGFVDVKVEVGWKQSKQIEKEPGIWGPQCRDKEIEGKSEMRDFPFLVIRGRRPE